MLRTSPRKRQEERRLLNEYAILLHKRAVFNFKSTQIAAGFEFLKYVSAVIASKN